MGKLLKFRVWREQQEAVFDDAGPTLLTPKKVVLTPAQKYEMEKAIKAVKGKEAKERVRREYEYEGLTGIADPIDTEPEIDPSPLSS
jgi:hypothetical protein